MATGLSPASKLLTALTKRIAERATALSVEDPAGLDKALAAVKR